MALLAATVMTSAAIHLQLDMLDSSSWSRQVFPRNAYTRPIATSHRHYAGRATLAQVTAVSDGEAEFRRRKVERLMGIEPT